MEKISQTELSHLAVIHLRGQDTLKFLQGQCTADVNSLEVNTPLLGAFCTAKGRAISNMWLVKGNVAAADFYMICEKEAANALYKHLSKYIPFFRGTKMTYQPDAFQGIGFHGTGAFESAQRHTSSTEQGFACQWGEHRAMAWLPSADFPVLFEQTSIDAFAQWQVQDIKENKLWLSAEQVERWIPQNVSLDDLGGISFKKGCYTGQEVIARLHFKGKSKKRLFAVQWASEASVSTVMTATGAIGDVIQQASVNGQSYALAVLKEDNISDVMYGDENQQLIIELLH